MKKKFLSMAIIATSVLSFIQNAKAQNSMLIGVEGTPHLSMLYNKDDMDNNAYKNVNTINGSFGLSLQYNITKMVGVGINGLYSFQGQRYKLNDVERYKKLEYIKIPVMVVYTSDINSKVMFIGKIGPQFGLLMNAKLTDKDGNSIIDDHSNAYEDFDIGGAIYAGAGFKLSDNLLLDASLRGDYGFTDAENKDNYKLNINNPSATTNGNGSSPSNRAMTSNVTIGVTIGLRYMINLE